MKTKDIVEECWNEYERLYPDKAFFNIGQIIRFGKLVEKKERERILRLIDDWLRSDGHMSTAALIKKIKEIKK